MFQIINKLEKIQGFLIFPKEFIGWVELTSDHRKILNCCMEESEYFRLGVLDSLSAVGFKNCFMSSMNAWHSTWMGLCVCICTKNYTCIVGYIPIDFGSSQSSVSSARTAKRELENENAYFWRQDIKTTLNVGTEHSEMHLTCSQISIAMKIFCICIYCALHLSCSEQGNNWAWHCAELELKGFFQR